MYKNADELLYDLYLYRGVPVLFSPFRIKRDSLKEGLYLYETRNDSDANIVSMGHRIIVDFWGSIISDTPLIQDGVKYVDIEDEIDLVFLDGRDDYTLDKYLRHEYILKDEDK